MHPSGSAETPKRTEKVRNRQIDSACFSLFGVTSWPYVVCFDVFIRLFRRPKACVEYGSLCGHFHDCRDYHPLETNLNCSRRLETNFFNHSSADFSMNPSQCGPCWQVYCLSLVVYGSGIVVVVFTCRCRELRKESKGRYLQFILSSFILLVF